MTFAAIHRRAFLCRALCLGVACSTSAWLPACAQTGDEPFDPQANPEAWAKVPADFFAAQWLADARHIGKQYLSTAGRTNSESTTAAAVATASAIIARDKPDDELVLDLVQAISDDFEKSSMVVVAGWVLAQTEAEVCALLWLRSQDE